MDEQLIDQLRAYRGELAHEACAHGFAQRTDRDKVLARMLAADRLLSLVVEPLPPVAEEPAIDDARQSLQVGRGGVRELAEALGGQLAMGRVQ